jgi:aspartate kinase
LAATGEQASSALLAIALQCRGHGPAVSYAGWQVPVRNQQRVHQSPHRIH